MARLIRASSSCGAGAGEEVEPRARTPWRRAPGRWRRASRPSSMWSRGSKPSAAKSRGVPTVSSTVEVLLAAGRRLVGGRGWGSPSAPPATPPRRRSAPPRPTSPRRRAPWCGRGAAFSSPCGLRDLLAQRLLLRTKVLERRDRRTTCRVGRQRPVHDVGGEPALGLGGSDTVGVVAEQPGVDHGFRLSSVAALARAWEVCHASTRRGMTGPASVPVQGVVVLDRPRAVILTWAAVCFALFAVLAVAVTRDPTSARQASTTAATGARSWADDHGLLRPGAAAGRGGLRHASGMTLLTAAAGRGRCCARSTGARRCSRSR